MIITRDIIRKDIQFTNWGEDTVYTYDNICFEINRIERTLLNLGCQKGDIISIVHHQISPFHVALVFAAAELGLQMLVIDMPASVESLPYNKMAQYGPANFTIYDGLDIDRPVKKLVYDYSDIVIHVDQISKDGSPIEIPYTVEGSDVIQITSSSGTTNWSKKVIIDHEECYTTVMRNIWKLKYKEEDKIAHSKNLHHGASLFTTLLPTLAECKYHYGASIPDYKGYFINGIPKYKEMIEYINANEFNRFMIPNEVILDEFFRAVDETIGKFKRTLICTVYTFTQSQKLVDICKKYNVEFLATYGNNGSHIHGLTAQLITKDTEVIERCIGKFDDGDIYRVFQNEDGSLRVESDLKVPDEVHIIDDNLEIRDDGYAILHSRVVDENAGIRAKVAELAPGVDCAVVQNGEDKYLALFEETDADLSGLGFKNILNINKELFSAEAKLNYDALRGHFIYYDNE